MQRRAPDARVQEEWLRLCSDLDYQLPRVRRLLSAAILLGAVSLVGGALYFLRPEKKEAPLEFPQLPEEPGIKGERMMISDVESALRSKDTKRALRTLDLHRRRYPEGKLREEREGLKIIALAQDGQSAAAQEDAASFKKKYPSSVFLPMIDEALNPPQR
jgi:hypothetical protein